MVPINVLMQSPKIPTYHTGITIKTSADFSAVYAAASAFKTNAQR